MNTMKKNALLGAVSVLAMTVASSAVVAQEVDITTGDYTIGVDQFLGTGGAGTSTITSTAGVTVQVTALDVTDSSTTVGGDNGNSVASSLIGNLNTSTLTSTVNSDPIGASASTSVSGIGAAVGGANLAVASTQIVEDVSGSVGVNAQFDSTNTDILNSTIELSNNTSDASGTFNNSTNVLTSVANDTTATAGVASSQIVADDFYSSGSVSGGSGSTILSVANDTVFAIEANISGSISGSVSGSTLELSGNEMTAVASANNAANTLSVSANDMRPISSSITTTSASLTNATATAANTLTSYQGVGVGSGAAPQLSASVDGEDAGFSVEVDDLVIGSTISNIENSATALLIGNDVENELSVSANSLVTEGEDSGSGTEPTYGAAAAVSNSQIFGLLDGAEARASALGESSVDVLTSIGTTVTDSTVTTSDNNVSATAVANTGENRLLTTASNNIDTVASGGPGATANALSGTVGTTGAGFELSSAQLASGGTITATLQNDAGTDSVTVRTNIGDDITASTITSTGNTLSATAVGNQITSETNELSITGNTVSTTTALANNQTLGTDVQALIGSPGTPFSAGIPDEPFDVFGIVDSGGTFTADLDDLTNSLDSDQIAAFIAQYSSSAGWTYDSETQVITFDPVPAPTSGENSYPSSVAGTPDTPAVPAAGGVIVSALGSITDSTVAVDSNTTRGSVTGNIATNELSVSAANLAGSDTLTESTAASGTASIGIAEADNALANVQESSAVTLESDVAGEFSILVDVTDENTYETTGSTLSVSDNNLFSTADANVVSNSIDLTATNAVSGASSLGAGAALSSLQDSESIVTARSNMSVSAPAAMVGSTLALDGNRTEAIATVNTASNNITVDSTNISSISGAAGADLNVTISGGGTLSDPTAIADFALANQQGSTGAVTAAATANIVNQDAALTATDSIVNSSITVNGNVTLAIGRANESDNTITLGGAVNSSVTGGILNLQTSSSSVDVDATSIAGITLTGGNTAPLTTSSIEMMGNATSAQASGNFAQNSFNVESNALAGSGTTSTALNSISGVSSVDATYGVLNAQTNTGDVNANASATYQTTMIGQTAVSASQINIMNNVIEARAVGNDAANTVSISALDFGTNSAAIGNVQQNSGAILSSTSGSTIGSVNTGAVDNSTISVGGSSISSSSIGNRATNTVVRSR